MFYVKTLKSFGFENFEKLWQWIIECYINQCSTIVCVAVLRDIFTYFFFLSKTCKKMSERSVVFAGKMSQSIPLRVHKISKLKTTGIETPAETPAVAGGTMLSPMLQSQDLFLVFFSKISSRQNFPTVRVYAVVLSRG